MKPVYIFGGDSFTWGEGLELYMDTPYWINERNYENRWEQIGQKQFPDAVNFRESNRFSALVSKYFDGISVINDYNGGSFDVGAFLINDNMKLKPKAVIYQFTSYSRMYLHFSRFCECEFCRPPQPLPNVLPYTFYLDCLRKKLNNENFNETDLYFIQKLKEKENIELIPIEKFHAVNDIFHFFDPIFQRNIDIFFSEYVSKWSSETKVLLIDSWDTQSSELICKDENLKKYLVPLKGYDGNYYYEYPKWEKTFPHKRIEDEFPATKNGHPTLLQHKYLSESIIEALQ
jgi:hypothetical protein